MLAGLFGIQDIPDIKPRYNIAPTQQILVLRNDQNNTPHLDYLRWGLIPHWAKDPSIGNHMINARSETVDEKPSFKSAFKHHRCIIPASGFYEWQKDDGRKQPYYITMKDSGPMLFAGLWDTWKSLEGNIIESCSILTTTSNEVISPLHERMPVILTKQDIRRWLDIQLIDSDELKPLLIPYKSNLMQLFPVSDMVNSPKNDNPECIARLANTSH
jgi:putative SOS response-associated peptidase YedK